MQCFHINNQDPYFCLAAEEYLLKNLTDDIFMVWQADHTVVVGKHQNAMAEIDYRYVRENSISVARRISGGGTVYHDKGNVNFVFIHNVESPALISFRRFLEPVVDFLGKLGVTALITDRNDLVVEGRKVSGNAQHVFKNRVLHHGTLLFSSEIEKLGKALRVVPGRYFGKAVPSNRSPVANISDFLSVNMDSENFADRLMEYQLSVHPDSRFSELEQNETAHISEQAREKFSSWDWCFGYSPGYNFRNEVNSGPRLLKIDLQVERGFIIESRCSGEFDGLPELNRRLVGKRHCFEDLSDQVRLTYPGITEDFIYGFF